MMAAHLIARPLTFLSIPLELRQNVYRHYAVRFDRRLRLCPDSAIRVPWPSLPCQILATCHQVHDEVLAIEEDCIGPLKVDLDFSPRLRLEDSEREVRESILAKYGKLVDEAGMDEFHCDDVRLKDIFRYCTRMKKLTVYARHCEVEVEGSENQTKDWWLKSDEVRDWLWPVWKQQVTGYWTRREYLKLLRLLNGEKEEGRVYSVQYIATFDLLDCDNTLYIVFDGDTGQTLQRWFAEPCGTRQDDGDEDDGDNDGGDDNQGDAGQG